MGELPLEGWSTAPPTARTSLHSDWGVFENIEEEVPSDDENLGRPQTTATSPPNPYDESSQLRKFFDEDKRKKAREALRDRVNYDIQLYLSASWELQEKYWSPRPITRDRLMDLSTP